MIFPCTKCGLCCRKTDALRCVGLPIKHDGSCFCLGPDNLCALYELRPSVCRVDDGAKDHPEGELDYYRKTAEVCNRWIKEAGLPSIYEVKIP